MSKLEVRTMKYLTKETARSVKSEVLKNFYETGEIDNTFINNLKEYAYYLAEKDLANLNNFMFNNNFDKIEGKKTFVLNIRSFTQYDCFEALSYIDPILAHNLYDEDINEYIAMDAYYFVQTNSEYSELSERILEMLNKFYNERVSSILESHNLKFFDTSNKVIVCDPNKNQIETNKDLFLICNLA